MPIRKGSKRSSKRGRDITLPNGGRTNSDPQVPSTGAYVSLTVLGRPISSVSPKSPTDLASQFNPVSPGGRLDRSPSECGDTVVRSASISGPQAANPQKSEEFQKQKLGTLKIMHEQVRKECEQYKNEFERTRAEDCRKKYENKRSVLQTLEKQINALLPNLSQASKPPPPPTSTGPPSITVLRRAGSGDGLNKVTSPDRWAEPSEGASKYQIPATPQSAPWLTGGRASHKKTGSMPDTLSRISEENSGKDLITVARSLSDSRKREVADTLAKQRNQPMDVRLKRQLTMRKTSSLPSYFQGGSGSEHSPSHSPSNSPTLHDAVSESTTSDSLEEMSVEDMTSKPSFLAHDNLRVATIQEVPSQTIIPFEEEEFGGTEVEQMQLNDPGPFRDLLTLKQRPAYMAVFLNYLISNRDPESLLFYLITETYPNGNLKELKKWAYEIYITFLGEKAPLRVPMDESVIVHMDLAYKQDKEEHLRNIFYNARICAQNEISDLLRSFHTVRSSGLGAIYGDENLTENMDSQSELKAVENCLLVHLEKSLIGSDCKSIREMAMASALATYIKQVANNQSSSKLSNTIDSCPTFNTKDKRTFKISKSKKSIAMKGHHLNMTHFTMARCAICQKYIWGPGVQSYQCENCDIVTHKNCTEDIAETCEKSKKGKKLRPASVFNIIRKPTNTPGTLPRGSGDDSPSSVFSSSTLMRSREETDESQEDAPPKVPVRGLIDAYNQISSPDDAKSPLTPPRSRSPLPPEGEDKTGATSTSANIGRSESFNKQPVERKVHAVRRTQSDVRVDDNTVHLLTQSDSSSSLSNSKSLDSPSGSSSTEILHDLPSLSPSIARTSIQDDDSDFAADADLPLESFVGKELLRKLKPKEKKRLDVVNELLTTELSHVRTLKVMERLFYHPLANDAAYSGDFCQLVFPNLPDLLSAHCSLHNAFKARRKDNPLMTEVADLLLERFNGEAGKTFENVCSIFCQNQKYALEHLRIRQRKDQKLATFLTEAHSNHLCRRLELKDMIPMVMQRLTKYPLLIESLMKFTTTLTQEYNQLKLAFECSRKILHSVNQAVKEAENRQKLADLQKRLDKKQIESSSHPSLAEYKQLDLTRHRLLFDGPLLWQVNKKMVEVHAVLLESLLILLQKQDDKLVLKTHTSATASSDSKLMHNPIIKLKNLLVRHVATDPYGLFLVSPIDGPQIYQMRVVTVEERKKWIRLITDAVDTVKDSDREHVKVGKMSSPGGAGASGIPEESKLQLPTESPMKSASSLERLADVGKAELINHSELIQPDEVVVSDIMMTQAQQQQDSQTTRPPPQDRIRRVDERISQLMEEKRHLVADQLNVPQEHFNHISEIASSEDEDKGPRELLLSSFDKLSSLSTLLSSSLHMTETHESAADAPAPTQCEEGAVGGAAAEEKPREVMVTLAYQPLKAAIDGLNRDYQQLLKLVLEQEKVRARQEQELRLLQETNYGLLSVSSQHSRPNSFISVGSSDMDLTPSNEPITPLLSAETQEAVIINYHETELFSRVSSEEVLSDDDLVATRMMGDEQSATGNDAREDESKELEVKEDSSDEAVTAPSADIPSEDEDFIDAELDKNSTTLVDSSST